MSDTRTWLRVGRRCAHTVSSACVTTVCWFVWIALGALLVALVTVAFNRELTVPGFLLRRLERKLEFAQLSAHFGRTAFDPSGDLLLEGVQLRGAGIDEPLAYAAAIRLHLDLLTVLAGDFDVHQIEVSGARFDCPAIVSPSGLSQPLVADFSATIQHDGANWTIPDATFTVGRVFVAAALDWEAPAAKGGAAHQPLPQDLLRRYIALARRGSAVIHYTDALEGARLRLTASAKPGGAPRLRVDAAVDHATIPVATGQPELRVENLGATVETAWRESGLDPLQLTVSAETVAGPYGVVVRRATLQTEGHLSFQPLRWSGSTVEFAASALARDTDTADHPRLTVQLDSFTHLRAELAALARGDSPVALRCEVDTAVRSATIDLETQLGPEFLNDAAARAAVWRKSRILAQLAFAEPAWLRGHAELGPDWKLREARATGRLGAGVAYGTELAATEAEVVIDPQRLLVEPLVFHRPDAEVRGSYEMDLHTQDYRFLLRGHFFPSAIDSWFSGWWTNLWDDFHFGATPPDADLDILGRWRSPELSIVYGWADIAPVTLRGVPLDRLQATFFIRPEHYDIIHFDARRAALFATGGFTRHDDSTTKKPRWIEFGFHSTLPLGEGAKLFGPEGEQTVAPFVFDQPPDLHASGRMDWDEAGLHQSIKAEATAPGVFRFHDFPVEHAHIAFALLDRQIDIHTIEAQLAGGTLAGSAKVDGPDSDRQLEFTGSLNSAKLAGVVQTWMDYRALTAPPGTKPGADAATSLGPDGRVNLALTAAGPVDNLYALHGNGGFTIRGAKLADIEMFGALSRLLRGTLLGFTSLQLSDASAKFALNGEHLDFSTVKLTGATAAVRGHGRYTMPADALNFNVKLYPFRESNFPPFSVLGTMLTPLSHAFEVRLTGTLAKPEWSLAATADSLPATARAAAPSNQKDKDTAEASAD